MGVSCCKPIDKPINCCDYTYRNILWAVLIINIVMFLVEIGYGFSSHSQSLLADALDFFCDASNCAISLFVLNKSLHLKAKASLIKGASMGVFGIWVIASTVYKVFVGELPKAEVMGVIGLLALIANIICVALLYKFRQGDSNRESVWICSRNDAIANIAVMIAAYGVFVTSAKWPDLIVAFIISSLAIMGSYRVCKSAMAELKS